MLDFLNIAKREKNRGKEVEISPKFVVCKSHDLMIKGSDFYAAWIEELGRWSTDEIDVVQVIDNYVREEVEKVEQTGKYDYVKPMYVRDTDTRRIDAFHRFCKHDMRDSYHILDQKLVFANSPTNKKDYSSKRLSYPLEEGSIDAYMKLTRVLYSEEEIAKIEWAIGSIVTGDSRKIQKFMVLYGSAGTGKSTILNIIQMLFEGYCSTFDAKALGSASSAFALEAFNSNPLVAIQHDGDLSKIEDNTKLNSLVSHEELPVNEKFKSMYKARYQCFLIMGTNRPVKITDAKSGLIRRLIDVTPTGNKVPSREYDSLMKQIPFELGAIAWHCKEVYLANPTKYNNYIPVNMLGASNDFYNFVMDCYTDFEKEDEVSLQVAWERYKNYCEVAKVPYPMSRRPFQEELKNYFKNFEERRTLSDGTRVRSYYSGFRKDIFESKLATEYKHKPADDYISVQNSILDDDLKDCPAQYANDDGKPSYKWAHVSSTLKDLDTSKLHYVKVPLNHIVIDFDLKGPDGKKSRERNLEEASKWKPTYGEFSKSGAGVHLHYIYDGDVTQLDPIYADGIEVKVYKGNSSLRRLLTKCNNLPIAHLNSGLPLKKEEKKLVSQKQIMSEKGLREQILRNMRKEVHGFTTPSMCFIKQILDDCYAQGLEYDVSDMAPALISFAMGSTHNKDRCLKMIDEMKLSNLPQATKEEPVKDDRLIFYDVEVFPNLFLINWKLEGPDCKVVRMINPSPEDVQKLTENRLVGFNCRRYDNHILYARIMGYDNAQLYNLSKRIVEGDRNAFFGNAYNLSYTDVYDFSSKKQSLKKFEIELGIHHQELGLPWDQPVDESLWQKVAEYCDNDVIATEATFNARKADFIAREILADVAEMSVNDTTNSLTTKIIFDGEKHPQGQFNYRNMGDVTNIKRFVDGFDEFTAFDAKDRPIFPHYIFDKGKSIYRDEEVGEGGYVYAEPGIYGNVALLDIASMHPHSIIAEQLFGELYTQRFKDIVDARIAIKHGEFDKAKTMLGGKLAKYLDDKDQAKNLAQALKIAINSVYGLTAAKFEHPFHDPRNKDNIVAKRGALFMVNLKHEVQKRGFKVAHIKTDSIKIPDATPEIISFVMEYGKMYGYTFEHEATYERMCLVNDAVYIAKYDDGHWTATGTQFQVPYVFKTLFSKEEITFDDLCETKAVSGDSAIYLDMCEDLPEGEHDYIFIGRVGQFTPIKEGCGGGILYRNKDDKYYAVTGTKGFKWLESEMVRNMHLEDCVDLSYYYNLVNDAKAAIEVYSDIPDVWHGIPEWFYSDVPYKGPEPEKLLYA